MDRHMTYKILRISYEKLGGKVNRWSPLTHTSDYMTTSRPAAATQMAARVSPAMHASNVFFTPDALPAATLPIFELRDRLRICWLAYTAARLYIFKSSSTKLKHDHQQVCLIH